ncbi:MAG: hypothetical protein ACLFSY_10990 [Desulfonatronovibrionaceae bacterium]
MEQFVVTPAAGKRLIALALAREERIRFALENNTLAVLAGTTNGYIAEEILKGLGREAGFFRSDFYRGLSIPPGSKAGGPKSDFPGDVILHKGEWLAGQTIFDVIHDLGPKDVILKGGNALDIKKGEAGVLIGHPRGGTTVCAMQAVVGRRTGFIVPIGLEKRVDSGIREIAGELNSPGASGVRMLPLPGEVFTELDAIAALSGAQARVMAAGGVCGAEGAVWLAVSGSKEEEKAVEEIMDSVSKEPPFSLRSPDSG